eukprot:5812964-Amphidinium_carterae.2
MTCHLWSEASLTFFYDAIDGPPAIREVLLDIIGLCPKLETLTIAGHGLDSTALLLKNEAPSQLHTPITVE